MVNKPCRCWQNTVSISASALQTIIEFSRDLAEYTVSSSLNFTLLTHNSKFILNTFPYMLCKVSWLHTDWSGSKLIQVVSTQLKQINILLGRNEVYIIVILNLRQKVDFLYFHSSLKIQNRSLHLAREYALIFVRDIVCLEKWTVCPMAKFEGNCDFRGTDIVQRQISVHNFDTKSRLLC